MASVRVFCGCSLDGFIAGPGDELDWLEASGDQDGDEREDMGFQAFLDDSGSLLMGRRTYDVVAGFDGPWFYGETPVFVATHRPLAPHVPQARAVSGTPHELLAAVQDIAPGNVYLDGGTLIRAFLDAGLIDEITVTVVPYVLGAGIPLFAGVARPRPLRLIRERRFRAGAVQLTYVPV